MEVNTAQDVLKRYRGETEKRGAIYAELQQACLEPLIKKANEALTKLEKNDAS